MALHLAERIQDHDDRDCLVDIHAHILDMTHWTPPCGWNLGYCLFKITTSGASFHITCPDIRGVPEKSGQHREVGSRLFTCLVKRCQRSRCKGVAKIMQARCFTLRRLEPELAD